ncbi:MAG TPA: hypothetical protein PKC40_01995 [Saprospiraceae bacterium]|nr:hypothetical protein [Saprospiraceae bacterium]
MPKPKNVTYLLGAGASAESLPVVSNMKGFYKPYIKILKDFIPDSERWYTLRENFSELCEKIIKHNSPDTFAKKLWLRGNEGRKIIELKYFLSGFFLWLEDVLSIEKLFYFSDEIIGSDWGGKIISTSIDLRYDSFLATILQKNKSGEPYPVLPNHINIISWNYDTQIERAYCDFFSQKTGIEQAVKHLKMYPKPHYKVNIETEGTQTLFDVKVVKLNGTAGDFISYEDSKNGNIRIYDGETSEEKLKKILENNYQFLKKQANIDADSTMNEVMNIKTESPFLNFAWESENPISKKGVDLAIAIMEKTDVLIIIGYSFPNFNREIDKKLLNAFWRAGSGKTIYYQAPQPSLDGLVRRLKGLTDSQFHKQIIPYDETDQFLIPYEI